MWKQLKLLSVNYCKQDHLRAWVLCVITAVVCTFVISVCESSSDFSLWNSTTGSLTTPVWSVTVSVLGLRSYCSGTCGHHLQFLSLRFKDVLPPVQSVSEIPFTHHSGKTKSLFFFICFDMCVWMLFSICFCFKFFLSVHFRTLTEFCTCSIVCTVQLYCSGYLLSLVGTATSINFLSRQKFCRNKCVFVATNMCLSWQKYACRDRIMFVANTCLSWQK